MTYHLTDPDRPVPAPDAPPPRRRGGCLKKLALGFLALLAALAGWLYWLSGARQEGDLASFVPASADAVLVLHEPGARLAALDEYLDRLLDSRGFSALGAIEALQSYARRQAETLALVDQGSAGDALVAQDDTLLAQVLQVRRRQWHDLRRAAADWGVDLTEDVLAGDLVVALRLAEAARAVPPPGTVLVAEQVLHRTDQVLVLLRPTGRKVVLALQLLDRLVGLDAALEEAAGADGPAWFPALRGNLLVLAGSAALRDQTLAVIDGQEPGFVAARGEGTLIEAQRRATPDALATFALAGDALRAFYRDLFSRQDPLAGRVEYAEFDTALDLDPADAGQDLMARSIDPLRRLFFQPAAVTAAAGAVTVSETEIGDAGGRPAAGLALGLALAFETDPARMVSPVPVRADRAGGLTDARMHELAERFWRLRERAFDDAARLPAETAQLFAVQLDHEALLEYEHQVEGDPALRVLFEKGRANFDERLTAFLGYPEAVLAARERRNRDQEDANDLRAGRFTPSYRGFLFGLSPKGRANERLEDELIDLFVQQLNDDQEESRRLKERVQQGEFLRRFPLPAPHFVVDLRGQNIPVPSIGYEISPAGARTDDSFAFAMESEWLVRLLATAQERPLAEQPTYAGLAGVIAALHGGSPPAGHFFMFRDGPRWGSCLRVNETADLELARLVDPSVYEGWRADLRARGVQGDEATGREIEKLEAAEIERRLAETRQRHATQRALGELLAGLMVQGRLHPRGARLELSVALAAGLD